MKDRIEEIARNLKAAPATKKVVDSLAWQTAADARLQMFKMAVAKDVMDVDAAIAKVLLEPVDVAAAKDAPSFELTGAFLNAWAKKNSIELSAYLKATFAA